jgi:hypothetical protein
LVLIEEKIFFVSVVLSPLEAEPITWLMRGSLLSKEVFMEAFLVKKYSHSGRISGGETFLPLSTKEQFVEECTLLSVAIGGLEFFHVKSQNVIPVEPVTTFDYSLFLQHSENWSERVKKCNEAALRVLIEEEKEDPTQYYNPLLFEKPE